MAIVSLPLVKRFDTATRPTMEPSGDNISLSLLLVCSVLAGRAVLAGGRGSGLVAKRDLHRHVGKDSRILLLQADPHLDGRILARGGRRAGDAGARRRPVRVGVEHRVDAGAGMD